MNYMGTYEVTAPNPPIKKKRVKRSKDDLDGSVMSSGVFAISRAKQPNPTENKIDEAREHDHGP